jgi:hypothetical protein
MTGDLPRPVRRVGVDHDELAPVAAGPHPLIDQLVRDRVARGADTDRPVKAGDSAQTKALSDKGSAQNSTDNARPRLLDSRNARNVQPAG